MRYLKIKKNLKKLLCLFSFLLLSFNLVAQRSLAKKSKTILELRMCAMGKYQEEIAKASLKEIPAENLGGWNEILTTTLFMLIRKTELYRGRMRLIVMEENNLAKCRVYPDGTILITTSLFDYIDAKLANTQNVSPRKIKNFNIEREKLLASFIVHQVANFAEESNLLSFSEDNNFSLEEIKANNLKTDEFAVVLLKLAGYNINLFYDHLEELNKIQRDSIQSKKFTFFFKEHFEPQSRIRNLLKNINNAEVIADEIFAIFESVQAGRPHSLEDAKQKIVALQQKMPTNSYLKRLATIVFDKKWRYGLTKKNETFLPNYAMSIDSLNTVKECFEVLNSDYGNLEIQQKAVSENQESEIPNINDYDEALRAYVIYLNSIEESGILSSYALLLHSSIYLNEKLNSLFVAKKAYLMENNTESKVAALNYASLLYTAGEDYTSAKIILDSVLNPTENKKEKSLFLRTGKIIDETVLLYNYTRLLFGLREIDKAELLKKKLKDTLFSVDVYEPIYLKKISLGSTADELIEFWGEPPLIQYNYFFEKWQYDFLNVEVVISQNENNEVEKIILNRNSNLTMPDDLRVGETRRAFEKIFGKSIYYCGDFKTYFYKGNRIQIFFVNNYARKIIITKI